MYITLVIPLDLWRDIPEINVPRTLVINTYLCTQYICNSFRLVMRIIRTYLTN